MSHTVTSPITGVQVLAVFSDCGFGAGFLTVKTADTIAWTPPRTTEGEAVTIEWDSTNELGSEAFAYGSGGVKRIHIKRTGSADLVIDATARVFCDSLKPTLEQLLDAKDVMAAVLQAQAAGTEGEHLSRVDLGKLEIRVRRLEARYARERGTSPRVAEGRLDQE